MGESTRNITRLEDAEFYASYSCDLPNLLNTSYSSSKNVTYSLNKFNYPNNQSAGYNMHDFTISIEWKNNNTNEMKKYNSNISDLESLLLFDNKNHSDEVDDKTNNVISLVLLFF